MILTTTSIEICQPDSTHLELLTTYRMSHMKRISTWLFRRTAEDSIWEASLYVAASGLRGYLTSGGILSSTSKSIWSGITKNRMPSKCCIVLNHGFVVVLLLLATARSIPSRQVRVQNLRMTRVSSTRKDILVMQIHILTWPGTEISA